VDVPWEAFILLLEYFSGLNSGVSFEELKEKFSEAEKECLTFNNKPICRIGLYKHPARENLRLNVNWRNLLDYLEYKAREYLERIKHAKVKEVGDIVSNMYGHIWENYLHILNTIGKTPASYIFPPEYIQSLEQIVDFKKLLRRTGDLGEVSELLNRLVNAVKHLDYVFKKQKLASARIFTVNLIMDVYHLAILTHRVISIPAAYMILRNILEQFIRLYKHLRCLERAKKENKGGARILAPLRSRVKGRDIEGISRKLGLGDTIPRLYSVCSEIIHKQPPLPFHSILEFKFFKNFLREYVKVIERFAEEIAHIKIHESKETLYGVNIELEQKSIELADKILSKHSEYVKKLLIEIVIEKLSKHCLKELKVLAFVFSITAPSWKKLKQGLFIEDDLHDTIKELSLYSVGLERNTVKNSLDVLESLKEQLAQLLKEKNLLEGPHELRTKTAFYILAMTLPSL